MELLSFDIEISDVFELEEGEDLMKYAPFNISCAATAVHGGHERQYFSISEDNPSVPADNMTQARAGELLWYLRAMLLDGTMICAWNGLGFDLRWIGHVAQNMELAGEIALKIYDPMFQFFNITGFPVALAKVAEAMGIKQEKLMDGADAPKKWRDGEHQLVMDYCLGDCQMTNQVVLAIQEAGELSWITKAGSQRGKPMPRLKTVEEVLREKKPYQGWMDKPILREKFHEWIPQKEPDPCRTPK